MSSLGDSIAAALILQRLEEITEISQGVQLIIEKLDELGEQMVTQAEAITAVGQKVTDILADFRAFRDAMLAERENLTAAGQAALDAANVTLDELDTEVGDADGSDTPVPPTP